MKLTLRDLFWLALLVAALTTWGIEHRRAAKEIEECRRRSWWVRDDRGAKPTEAEVKRRTVRQELSRMTDGELDAAFAATQGSDRHQRQFYYEPCLVEMASRGLSGRLQKHYDELMGGERDEGRSPWFSRNLELLTALRRAQGKHDPLTLRLSVNNYAWGRSHPGPCVQALVENIDAGQEAVYFCDGGDDRGGRRDRWRFVLTDGTGRQIADSNFLSMAGGGVSTVGPLKFGQTGRRVNLFDLRQYVAPPPSGRYQLQALYHNGIDIADERDVSGLIVSKSEPIAVIVDNPAPPFARQRRGESWAPLAVLAGGMVLTLMAAASRLSSRWNVNRAVSVSRRDLWWAAAMMAVALGLWLDHRFQEYRITDLRPDAHAEWSIRLADDGEG
jgi:hypothetical protein